MKDDNIIDKSGMEEQVIVQQKTIQKGSFQLSPGQKVYELDLANSMIYEAELGEKKALVGKDLLIRGSRDLEVKENHIYCAAINMKNAIKKFHKMLGTVPKKKEVNGGEE